MLLDLENRRLPISKTKFAALWIRLIMLNPMFNAGFFVGGIYSEQPLLPLGTPLERGGTQLNASHTRLAPLAVAAFSWIALNDDKKARALEEAGSKEAGAKKESKKDK